MGKHNISLTWYDVNAAVTGFHATIVNTPVCLSYKCALNHNFYTHLVKFTLSYDG